MTSPRVKKAVKAWGLIHAGQLLRQTPDSAPSLRRTREQAESAKRFIYGNDPEVRIVRVSIQVLSK